MTALCVAILASPFAALAQSGVWVQLYESAQEQMRQKQWSEARVSLDKAMPLADALGHDDPRYALTIGALGRILEHEERFKEAEPLLVTAEDVCVKANCKGQDVWDIIFAHQDLLIKTGRKQEAADANEKFQKVFGSLLQASDSSKDIWSDEFAAGMKDYRSRRFAGAESHFAKSLATAQQQIHRNLQIKKSMGALFALYREQHNYPKVDEYFSKLKDMITKVDGPNSVEIASLDDSYAQILEKQKRFVEEEHYERQAEKIRKLASDKIGTSGGSGILSNNSNIGNTSNSFNSITTNLNYASPPVFQSRQSALVVGGKLLYGSQTTSSSESFARESQIRSMEQSEVGRNASMGQATNGSSYMSRYNTPGAASSYMSRYNSH